MKTSFFLSIKLFLLIFLFSCHEEVKDQASENKNLETNNEIKIDLPKKQQEIVNIQSDQIIKINKSEKIIATNADKFNFQRRLIAKNENNLALYTYSGELMAQNEVIGLLDIFNFDQSYVIRQIDNNFYIDKLIISENINYENILTTEYKAEILQICFDKKDSQLFLHDQDGFKSIYFHQNMMKQNSDKKIETTSIDLVNQHIMSQIGIQNINEIENEVGFTFKINISNKEKFDNCENNKNKIFSNNQVADFKIEPNNFTLSNSNVKILIDPYKSDEEANIAITYDINAEDLKANIDYNTQNFGDIYRNGAFIINVYEDEYSYIYIIPMSYFFPLFAN